MVCERLCLPTVSRPHLQAESLVDTSERVEHHVDATSVGVAHDVGEPAGGAGVVDVLNAQAADGLLLGGGGRGVDLDAHELAHADGGVADTTCRGVDEHALARLDARLVDEGVPGSRVHGLHGGRDLRAHEQ